LTVIEVNDGREWIDVTESVSELRHTVDGRGLERVEIELSGTDVSVGWRCRYSSGLSIRFEGIIHEVVRKRVRGRLTEVKATGYSNLIAYDRHVVFRLYNTGTTAGEIIRDLASLEAGVDVTNVDDGPSLTAPWSIENAPALRVMLDVAKGTNYYLRMKPGRVLHFKPKTVGTPENYVHEVVAANVTIPSRPEDKEGVRPVPESEANCFRGATGAEGTGVGARGRNAQGRGWRPRARRECSLILSAIL